MTAIAIDLDAGLARIVKRTGSWRRRLNKTWRGLAAVGAAIDIAAKGVYHLYRNHRYYTFAKLINMAAVNVQFYFKTETVWGRPYAMKIESTNICNTKCQLCPTGIGLEGRPKGKMDTANYKKLIDELKWHLHALDLSMWGDPLIVPDIYDMISYAHDRGIWTYISSNLHAFKIDPRKGETKDQATRLVESGLDLMTCSLHGATQETFAIYQPGKSFDDTLAKLKHILKTRDAMGSKTPHIQLNFVVTKYNQHERDAFQKLADELGCKAVFSTPSLNIRFQNQDKQLVPLGLAEDVLEQRIRSHIQKWLPEEDEYALEPYRDLLDGKPLDADSFNGSKIFNCDWPWRQSVINWDGEVVTCCGSFDPAEDMGNVFEHGFAKVWNGAQYRAARRSFTKKLSDKDAENNACATCPGFML
ncbi:radical SAM/SPASM domain-containing protein [Mucisphaera sp.]|uniref:radical SAM/SPASM domain-containing protein n=1 Tax=Mucisphaera sp. TaxID=2913024 RepID=UPI003D12AB62